MAFPRTIRNFNVVVDGTSFFGRATEGQIPNPTVMTSAHRGAGMDGPIGIDMGLEAMTAEAVFAEWDPFLLGKFGRIERFVFRPAARGQDDLSVDGYIVTVSGLVTATEFGGLKPGEQSLLTLKLDVRYYKHEARGRVLHEIDLENAVRRIDGVDQNAELRRAMGL